MKDRTSTLMRALFVAAALWNLLGAGFGYFNTAFTFQSFFGRELADPLIFEIYQGAWGTTFVYFFGYLLVAHDPFRHLGIVIVGGIGKLGYALKLLQLFTAGLAGPVVLVVVGGDLLFVLLFVYYFFKLHQAKQARRLGAAPQPAPPPALRAGGVTGASRRWGSCR